MKFIGLFIVTVLLFSLSLFAQEIPANPDIAKILMELFTDWKGLGGLGIGMSVIVLIAQLLNMTVVDKLFEGKVARIIKQALVLLLGQIYTVLFLVKSGTGGLNAVIGLVASGGAMALYTVIKPLWEKEQ